MGRTETLPKREDYVHMGIVLSNALHRGLLVAGIGISLAGFGSEQAAEASIRNRLRGTVSVMGNLLRMPPSPSGKQRAGKSLNK